MAGSISGFSKIVKNIPVPWGEFQFLPRYLDLMDEIDYIKLNCQTASDVNMRNTIEIAHSMNKKCIVTNIDSEELYQKAVQLHADALQGTYVAAQLTTKAGLFQTDRRSCLSCRILCCGHYFCVPIYG